MKSQYTAAGLVGRLYGLGEVAEVDHGQLVHGTSRSTT